MYFTNKPMPEEAEKNNRSIHSILRPETVHPDMELEFISTSFFLPREVLHSNHWIIEPIKVISGEEWQETKEEVLKVARVHYDPDSAKIIAAAKHLGVSVRRHIATGDVFVVIKLWYGNAGGQFTKRTPAPTVSYKR